MSPLLLLGLLLCLAAAITDWRTGQIPNALTYPVLALSPFAHVLLSLHRGNPFKAALVEGGLSVVGMLLCGAVPLYMWRNNAIGGGDVKLFAALGALCLPRFGFEAEVYVFVAASLIAPAHLIYRGRLTRAFLNACAQVANAFRAKGNRTPLDPALASWFRLGPCFAIGFAVQVLLHWRAP